MHIDHDRHRQQRSPRQSQSHVKRPNSYCQSLGKWTISCCRIQTFMYHHPSQQQRRRRRTHLNYLNCKKTTRNRCKSATCPISILKTITIYRVENWHRCHPLIIRIAVSKFKMNFCRRKKWSIRLQPPKQWNELLLLRQAVHDRPMHRNCCEPPIRCTMLPTNCTNTLRRRPAAAK